MVTIGRYAAALPLHLLSILVFCGFGATEAWSQERVIQTLDQVKIYGSNALGSDEDVRRLPFNDPYRDVSNPEDQSLPTGITWPGGFVACKQTSADGLICLTKDEMVVNWPDPAHPTGSPELFSCNDLHDLLDERAPNTCTGLTADESPAIWLAGKNKGKTHSLVKVEARACGSESGPSQEIRVGGRTFCAVEWDTGRPLLLDVTRVEGRQSGRIPPIIGIGGVIEDGELVVGLEQRLDAALFSATRPGTYVTIPGGKTGWALGRKEVLQSIALLQSEDDGGGVRNHVLVTTSLGRILAKDLQSLQAPAEVVFTDEVCAGDAPPVYTLRASPKGKVVYMANNNCHRAIALEATTAPALKLVRAKEDYFQLDADDEPILPMVRDEVPALFTGPIAPEGLTVAPGEDLSLADCTGGVDEACPLVRGATLWSVSYTGDPDVTIYQIKNIPDCRWIIAEGLPIPEECTPRDQAGNPLDPNPVLPDAGLPAAGQRLNVEPLLPPDLKDALSAKGIELPGELLIAPQFRAQEDLDFRFEAFFVAVDPTTTFTGTYEGEFDTLLLAGSELGCKDTYGTTRWDVVTKISERFRSVDGLFIDMLVNTGCGTSKIKGQGFSLFSYNLTVTPHTYVDVDGDTHPDLVMDNDAVFARLLEKLFSDLHYIAQYEACGAFAGATGAYPISTTKCDTLLAALSNAGDKLGKCIEATYEPKQSASNQNCQSFLQQIGSFRDALAAPDPGPVGSDLANRVGELDVRYSVLMHVYDTRFAPSIPDGGFCVESNTCSP